MIRGHEKKKNNPTGRSKVGYTIYLGYVYSNYELFLLRYNANPLKEQKVVVVSLIAGEDTKISLVS